MYQEVCFNRGTEAGEGGKCGPLAQHSPSVILCLLRACIKFSVKTSPGCPFLSGRCFAFFKHTQMIYARYVKVAPRKPQIGRVKFKLSPGTGKAKFSLGEGKKPTESVTEGYIVSYSLCDYIFYLRCRAETLSSVPNLSLNLS